MVAKLACFNGFDMVHFGSFQDVKTIIISIFWFISILSTSKQPISQQILLTLQQEERY